MPKQTIIPLQKRTIIKRFVKPFIALLLVTVGLHFAMAANNWRPLAPGIDYNDLVTTHFTPWSHIHTFRINLQENTLSLTTAKETHQNFAKAEDYAQFSHAFIAINGGFFDKNYRPLGLRIRNHQQLSPLKLISWWGIFYTKAGHAYLSNAKRFKQSELIDFAIQSGPRLLINGRIPSLRKGLAERSALGITQDGQVILLVTEHAAMSTTHLAHLMKAPPLNCINALNLDGGSSSQLYAKINSFRLNVHGFSNVSDGITVHPRQMNAGILN
ncbi:MAG: hypothetical protein A3F46_00540 [Legionellales bacterium RIFCSPHIGHO2_12_FULL_42_9]|nr:MAG: hypothetical protein A3F46_00540 [Legionellales bacterium RIFCSPHIGHO2_12_FULL_42_9]